MRFKTEFLSWKNSLCYLSKCCQKGKERGEFAIKEKLLPSNNDYKLRSIIMSVSVENINFIMKIFRGAAFFIFFIFSLQAFFLVWFVFVLKLSERWIV